MLGPPVVINLPVAGNPSDDFRLCVKVWRKANLTWRCRVNKVHYDSVKVGLSL